MTSPFYSGQKLRASRLAQLANDEIFNSVGGCTLSSTSASYTNITNASKSFTKVGAASDTDLIVEISVGLYATVAPTVIKIGINVNSTDNDAAIYSVNSANVHLCVPTGIVRISGLAAGVYTVQARALRVSGTGTMTIDSNDQVSMSIRERLV